ncbi:MAG: hypothetical protein ACTSR8_17955 [Promethearchaeota archaeon]
MSSIAIQQLKAEEKIVFNVIKDYLNKNKTFNITEIVTFIIARFKLQNININKQGIKEILISLVKKKIVVEGSKLTKDSILKNETRELIFKYIQKNPGTHFNKVLRNLAINNYVTVWHIDILEKFGFIRREKFDNRFIYFEPNMNFEQVKILYYGSNKKCKQIFAYLQENNYGQSKTKIAQELQMHPKTANKYLDAMEKLGMIVKEKIDNNELYFPN